MSPYIGRFAPSPSGSLHFGSLVAALGSYLRARSLKGQWLLRMEDIDPPREVKGAADDILRTLEAFGLHWDGSVLYQSQRVDAYQQALNELLQHQQAYYCQCTRKMVREMGGIYNGRCRQHMISHGAIRLHNTQGVALFSDELKGEVKVDADFAEEDFIIKRSDGLYAYQLAVVLDDAHQGITEVVRGSDLLEATCRQLSLYQTLDLTAPKWLHLPLACTQPNFKLSKQNAATAVDVNPPQKSLSQALAFLGQPKVDLSGDIEIMLAQAVEQFRLDAITKENEILIG
ncbi:tRNA glutamyl-Q(34) synthetase GluQRS [Parashewanella curva]|uniref:Glutamyl-Q tRNA(Asp) synthetase n=1 Tax=Parashewanella curva TaxID=2338552 RepID=A0A3L8PWQ1_9GAMM|nr:tRNA glutamyl-Q(34) synthetase GluQRS [Parashewanella curva]RLV59219.1 tRNA glutamyl-Q(34) synthetase GluQRS [Parashewanella curva]